MLTIGIDESGKGDFFGPLVTAAFLAPDSEEAVLRGMGVRDGKQISENKILTVDEKLRAAYPHSILLIRPAEYNELYKRIKNLNLLLADCHARVIGSILKDHTADQAVSDKFGKAELVERALVNHSCEVKLIQLERGERIVQVAAASILARAAFIRWMKEAADKLQMDVPRGASSLVDAAGRKIVERHGMEMLPQLAKLHFKNYQRAIDLSLLNS